MTARFAPRPHAARSCCSKPCPSPVDSDVTRLHLGPWQQLQLMLHTTVTAVCCSHRAELLSNACTSSFMGLFRRHHHPTTSSIHAEATCRPHGRGSCRACCMCCCCCARRGCPVLSPPSTTAAAVLTKAASAVVGCCRPCCGPCSCSCAAALGRPPCRRQQALHVTCSAPVSAGARTARPAAMTRHTFRRGNTRSTAAKSGKVKLACSMSTQPVLHKPSRDRQQAQRHRI